MSTPCLVFALAIISTVTPDKALKEQIREDVSSVVVSAVTAQAAQGSSARPALVPLLRSAVRGAVARVMPQLIQLAALSSGSRHIAQQLADQFAQQLTDQVAQQLADQVVEDLALRDVLDAEDEVAPRFIGAFTLGVAEILIDAINTVMRERKVNRKHAEKPKIKQT